MSVALSRSNNQRQSDPTRSKTLRREYARHLRKPLRRLKGAIWSGIAEDRDLQILSSNAPDSMPVFRFETEEEAVAHFMDWLGTQTSEGFLDTIDGTNNKFIRNAYTKGIVHADSQLRKLENGYDPNEIQAVLNKPIHIDRLQELYTRNLTLLKKIDSDLQRAIREELSKGVAEGVAPKRMARRLNGRVNAIGIRRANLIARTEVINAHSTATLNRFEESGITSVTIKAEVSTAADNRVCPKCLAIEGEVMETEEVRKGTFEFDNQDWPIQPPIHPNCRCVLLPVT